MTRLKVERDGPNHTLACPHCGREIRCYRFSGMADLAPHFFCDTCSNLYFDEAQRALLYRRKATRRLLREMAASLPDCPCGGRFRPEADPRCPGCGRELEGDPDPLQRLTQPGAVLLAGARMVTPVPEDELRFGEVAERAAGARAERRLSIAEVAEAVEVPRCRLEAIERADLAGIEAAALLEYVGFLDLERWFDKWAKGNADLLRGRRLEDCLPSSLREVGRRCARARRERGLSRKEASREARVPQYRIRDVEQSASDAIDPACLGRYVAFLGLAEWFETWCERHPELSRRLRP